MPGQSGATCGDYGVQTMHRAGPANFHHAKQLELLSTTVPGRTAYAPVDLRGNAAIQLHKVSRRLGVSLFGLLWPSKVRGPPSCFTRSAPTALTLDPGHAPFLFLSLFPFHAWIVSLSVVSISLFLLLVVLFPFSPSELLLPNELHPAARPSFVFLFQSTLADRGFFFFYLTCCS